MKLNLQRGIKHLETDFVIVSKTGKEIPCHKFVLAAMSPVFEAMFDMKDSIEVSNGKIEIPDASEKALETMVDFMYNHDEDEDEYEDDDEDEDEDEDVNDDEDVDEDVNDDKDDDEDDNMGDDEDDICQELLVLANKYDLKALAKKHLPRFIKNINGDNCFDAYAFGYLHEFKKVKNAALKLIVFIWDILKADKEAQNKLKTFSTLHPKEYKSLKNEIENFDYDGDEDEDENMGDDEDDADDIMIGKYKQDA